MQLTNHPAERELAHARVQLHMVATQHAQVLASLQGLPELRLSPADRLMLERRILLRLNWLDHCLRGAGARVRQAKAAMLALPPPPVAWEELSAVMKNSVAVQLQAD